MGVAERIDSAGPDTPRTAALPPIRRRVTAPRSHLVLILGAYAAAWGLLLLNRGLYWDDWTLQGITVRERRGTFVEAGAPLDGFLFNVLWATPSPALVAHAATFAFHLAIALLAYTLAHRTPGLTRRDALVIALAAAVLPLNFARIAIIDTTYGLYLTLFLVGAVLLQRTAAERSVGFRRRTTAAACFLVSFTISSLLVFYAVPMALALWAGRHHGGVLRCALRLPEFFLLPFVAWAVRNRFFRPHGLFDDYYSVTAEAIRAVPTALQDIPDQVVIQPLIHAAETAGWVGAAVALLAAIGAVVAWRRQGLAGEQTRWITMVWLTLASVGALVAATAPYLVIGLVPTINDWESRHQLLVPISLAILLAAIARIRWVGLPLVAALLAMCTVADARTLLIYQRDWYKQEAFIGWAEGSPAAKKARHILVIDHARELNALDRTVRFYEYSAIVAKATGSEGRLVHGPGAEPPAGLLAELAARPEFHIRGYRPAPVDLTVQIDRGPASGEGDTLRILRREGLGGDHAADVQKVITVRSRSASGSTTG